MPVGIKSFSLVTRGDAHAREAIVCMHTIRKYHGDVPILCLADAVSRDVLKDTDCQFLDFDNYGFSNFDIPHKKKQHFCPVSIYGKMFVMKEAIKRHQNTMFVDADVVLLSEINVENVELQLSQHFHRDQEKDRLYGKYNAGYIFAQKQEVPELWADLYLQGQGFYEQSPLEKLKNSFTHAKFTEDHNVGFWRKRMPHKRKITSLHFHHRKDAYTDADEHLTAIYDHFAKAFMHFIPGDIKAIMHEKT